MPPVPSLVGLYLEEHAALRAPDGSWAYAPATLERWTAALSTVTKAAGHLPPGQHPKIQETLEAIRRVHGGAQRQADPLLLEDVRLVCAAIAASAGPYRCRARARRDTALVLAAFAGGYRRSELSAHSLGDVTWHPGDGLHMRVAQSKTDQRAEGRVKGLPFGEDPDPLTCPVCAMLRWIQAVQAWDARGRAGLTRLWTAPEAGEHLCREPPGLPDSDAPLFRRLDRGGGLVDGKDGTPLPLSGHAVNDIIRHWCAEAGLDPDRDLTAHSARAGFVTEALAAGATAREVARQTFHESDRQVYAYQRLKNPLAGNAVTRIRF